MCWKHQSVYGRSLPNNHSIKTTTQPLLELNLFKLDWITDVKYYVHTKLQNKHQENKNNTPVGMQSAMHRAGSDTHAIVIQIWKRREKSRTVSFITGTHRKFINTSDYWYCLGGVPPQNCTQKWKEWCTPNGGGERTEESVLSDWLRHCLIPVSSVQKWPTATSINILTAEGYKTKRITEELLWLWILSEWNSNCTTLAKLHLLQPMFFLFYK